MKAIYLGYQIKREWTDNQGKLVPQRYSLRFFTTETLEIFEFNVPTLEKELERNPIHLADAVQGDLVYELRKRLNTNLYSPSFVSFTPARV